jgi:hypothetical protein
VDVTVQRQQGNVEVQVIKSELIEDGHRTSRGAVPAE